MGWAVSGKLLDPKNDKKTCAAAFPAIAALESVPVVGKVVTKLLGFCNIGVELVLKLASKIWFDKGAAGGWTITGGATPELSLKIILDMTFSKNYLSMKAWGGGGGKFDFKAGDDWGLYFSKADLRALMGWALRIWRFEKSGERPFSYIYPSSGGASPLPALQADPSVVGFETDWHVAPRDYVTENYGRFAPVASVQSAMRPTTTDTRLIENVFPLTAPALAQTPGGDLVLAWTHDDPAKPIMQGEEIAVAWQRNGAWNALRP